MITCAKPPTRCQRRRSCPCHLRSLGLRAPGEASSAAPGRPERRKKPRPRPRVGRPEPHAAPRGPPPGPRDPGICLGPRLPPSRWTPQSLGSERDLEGRGWTASQPRQRAGRSTPPPPSCEQAWGSGWGSGWGPQPRPREIPPPKFLAGTRRVGQRLGCPGGAGVLPQVWTGCLLALSVSLSSEIRVLQDGSPQGVHLRERRLQGEDSISVLG